MANMQTMLRYATTTLMVSFVSLTPVLGKQATNSESKIPLSTPSGVTLQPLGKYQGYGMDKDTAALVGHGQIVYASTDGMTLYTYDKDSPGKSVCVDSCEKIWPPLRVEAGATPVPGWSVITRADGSKQWALNGKPLYTFVEDQDPGSVGGNSPKRFGRGPLIGDRGSRIGEIPPDKPLAEGWQPAMQYPASLEELPPEIAVKEVEDAGGLVFVNDNNRTLYVFSGDPNADGKICKSPCQWRPLVAPKLAGRVGKFVPRARNDGISQWTYNGMGLYTFEGDLARGDANGIGVSPDWVVAYFARNFMPAGVTVQESYRLGKVLANANGRTLYRRDSYILQSGSGHGQRHGVLIRPAVGRDLGVDPRCTKECDRWHPFLAPSDAIPRGFWSVYDRPNGAKQWAYNGYALWTYDGDTMPGEINADDDWQIVHASSQTSLINIGTPFDGLPALYWAAAVP